MTSHPDPPRRRVALVTGASSGIGYELARLLARGGHDLVLVARGAERLDELAEQVRKDHGTTALVLAKDLTAAGASQEVYDEVTAAGLAVDVLVNNAGFGLKGPFAELPLADQEQMVQLNVMVPTLLTRLFLEPMLARGGGRILNVASTAAFQPGPLMAVYYASKAYLLSWSEALANELAGRGVTVTTLCPGPTITGFADRAGTSGSKLFKGPTMDARSVAEAGYEGLMAGRGLVVPGARNQFLAFGVRLAPRRLVTNIARRLQE